MVTGQIQETQLAKSGKSLGVKVGNKWYRTKEFHLEHEVGNGIEFEVTTSSLPDGKTLYWIGDYQLLADVPAGSYPEAAPPPVAASTKRENNRGRPDAADVHANGVLLLQFVGRCFAGYPFQTTDAVAVRTRAKMLYELGLDILSGKIAETETGPRRSVADKTERDPAHGIPGYSPTRPQQAAPEPETHTEDDPDDEIPF